MTGRTAGSVVRRIPGGLVEFFSTHSGAVGNGDCIVGYTGLSVLGYLDSCDRSGHELSVRRMPRVMTLFSRISSDSIEFDAIRMSTLQRNG